MNAVLYFSALGFAAMGVSALAAPRKVPQLFGVDSVGEDMVNEVRAVYGGFGCAIAVLLVIASQNPSLQTGVATTVSMSLLGMAAGRSIITKWRSVDYCSSEFVNFI